MKTKIFLSILTLGFYLSAIGQNAIELTFTAIDSAAYVQLDSIKVMNRTQGSETILLYPDTALVLDYQVGISEPNIGIEGFQVFQNYPNPITDHTTISFYVPERDKISLIATDILGRVVMKTEQTFEQGYHSYRFTPGNGNLFLFTARWRSYSSSIKILQATPNSTKTCLFEYIGSESSPSGLKKTEDIQDFLFNLGDELLYIGYKDALQSGMLNKPEEGQTYTFQFATNIPCPEMPTVEYQGHVYNTIQIFSQCWLKENLNVGTMISGTSFPTDNDIIEKYCYNNEPDSCTIYGGLYTWDEMMQYTTQQVTQGICPSGWHLPTDEEWRVMEGAVDSYYGIGDPEWEKSQEWRGGDAGANLKTTVGWSENGNGIDLYGFSALPGGDRYETGIFRYLGSYGYWLSATEGTGSTARGRSLYYEYDQVWQSISYPKVRGFSVRCLKD